jgi:hypothetical protein
MSRTFERFAGLSAILVGIGGLLYGVLFGAIVLGAPEAVARTWLALGLLGALFAAPVTVALYYRLRDTDRGFALLALLLGIFAALGQFENSALGLGNEITPELGGAAADPYGAFRFGLLGLALLIVAWLIRRGGALPRGLGYVAALGGVLLVIVYLGRLTGVIDPATEATVIPPVLYGLVVHPLFYVWLGVSLRRG